MPPVEIESVPLPVDAHAEIGIHLKIVEKATTIPLVNDAVTAVTPIITEAVTAATNLHTQVREANTVYNTVEDLILGGIKEATPTLTESVPEVVKTTLATTVGQLDTLACDGLDKLTTTIPQLNEPTQEIITNTTGEIVTVVNDVTDYVTSFSIAQWGLKTADKALDVTEKILHTLEPSDDPDTPLSPIFSLPLVATVLSCVKPTVAKVRALRRYLRSLRHGGRRRACATADETTIGWFLETFYINILLTTVFGIRIAPLCETTTDDLPLATSGKRKTPEPEDVEEETVVMLSDEKIAEYDEAQDPDYEPTEEETPDEPLEYDSQAEISQEHIADEEVTEGTTVEEVEEETVEATEESQEIVTEESSQEELVTEESSQEGTVEDDACNTPACEKVVVEGKHVVVEEVKPMGTLEDETTGEVEETTDMAEEVLTTETTETTDMTEEALTTETTDMTEEILTTETTDMTEEAHTTETTETTDMTEEVIPTETTKTTDMTEEVIPTETTGMTEEVLTTETTDMLATETTDMTEEVHTTETTDVTGEVVTETTGEEVHTTNTTEMTGEVETGEVVTETTGEEVHTTNTTEMTGEVEHTTDMEATS